MSAITVQYPNRKGHNVHFSDNQASGSHRPPSAFRSKISAPFAPIVKDSLNDRLYGIRKNVAIDHWFKDHGLQHSLKTTPELLRARASACIGLGKSVMRTLVVTITLIFHKIFQPAKSATSLRELRGQWNSVRLCAHAIVSPNRAKKEFLDYWKNLIRSDAPRNITIYVTK